ncbi:MAG TPA: hypothetical protein PLT59_11840 [Bacteroidales bacterium]|nr:hypothetical protein [Bacteroidales bacterium]
MSRKTTEQVEIIKKPHSSRLSPHSFLQGMRDEEGGMRKRYGSE